MFRGIGGWKRTGRPISLRLASGNSPSGWSGKRKLAAGVRSWSITGPYGSGKSAFALFLADLLAGNPPTHAVGQLIREGSSLPPGGFVPVLLVAERNPLGPALTRALADAVDEISPSLAEEVRRYCPSSGAGVAQAFSRAARCLQSHGYAGLVVIVDELGKFLEFAEANPTEGDVFLLQQVAEESQRSEAPILFVTILHSGLADYLPVHDEVRRAEWQKIQGRFRDVAFQPPAEQMIALVAQAIESQAPGPLAEAWAQEVERVARTGGVLAGATRHIPVDLLHRCVPLHPVTTLLLWPLFRSKAAQNERSLFAFLTSGEGFGFQEYLRRTAWDGGELPFPASGVVARLYPLGSRSPGFHGRSCRSVGTHRRWDPQAPAGYAVGHRGRAEDAGSPEHVRKWCGASSFESCH